MDKIKCDNQEIEVTDLVDSDFADYYEMLSDPVMAKKTGFEPVEDEKKAKMLFASENDTNKTFGIRLITSGKLIGIINVFPEIGDNFEPDFKNVELGYFMHISYQQRGYMTSALKAVIHQLTVPEIIEATVDSSNYPSQKVLHKLGFKKVDKYDNDLVFELSTK